MRRHRLTVSQEMSPNRHFSRVTSREKCRFFHISWETGAGPPSGYSAVGLGRRQARSNGSRQALGATSWWIALGPQLPGA